MVVKRFTDGNTKITIHDDSIVKSPEEVRQILQNIGKIVMKYEKARVRDEQSS